MLRREYGRKGLYCGFSDEQKSRYTKEAEEQWDSEIVRDSNAKWQSYSKKEQERIKEGSAVIYNDFRDAMQLGIDSESVLKIA